MSCSLLSVQGDNCGDKTCQAELGETCSSCAQDCACASGGCCVSGSCISSGTCSGTKICVGGNLINHCGDGIPNCGETCSNCPQDVSCSGGTCCLDGICRSVGTCSGTQVCFGGNWILHCGDGECNCGENSVSCPSDCASPLKGNGQSCSLGSECSSGYCIDGVCCTTSSCGTCKSCNLNGLGTCSNDASGTDPGNDCPSITCTNYIYNTYNGKCYAYTAPTSNNGYCNGAGACYSIAQSCTWDGPYNQLADCTSFSCMTCIPNQPSSTAGCKYQGESCGGSNICVSGGSCVNPYSTWVSPFGCNGEELGSIGGSIGDCSSFCSFMEASCCQYGGVSCLVTDGGLSYGGSTSAMLK
jgi:hypothetical protein